MPCRIYILLHFFSKLSQMEGVGGFILTALPDALTLFFTSAVRSRLVKAM
ncbi:hypothetical protein MIZ03_3164 [Rhodoferax lithotrophicus]|uniref:Uncharacterized protein n=1 Tax=Rhodoferax lithotrophicus TaxID=2798804 RepID=A0ABM7MPL0_9BURK|nr:hypothetical protein MIZ03_3164 [Rhodoferax sp. MIZ03]